MQRIEPVKEHLRIRSAPAVVESDRYHGQHAVKLKPSKGIQGQSTENEPDEGHLSGQIKHIDQNDTSNSVIAVYKVSSAPDQYKGNDVELMRVHLLQTEQGGQSQRKCDEYILVRKIYDRMEECQIERNLGDQCEYAQSAQIVHMTSRVIKSLHDQKTKDWKSKSSNRAQGKYMWKKDIADMVDQHGADGNQL